MTLQSTKDPVTKFFVDLENKWLASWEKNGLYKKYLTKNKQSSQTFSFQDGPITANNPMGVHHAWGRTYKDLWQKFHNLLGHKQRFMNGFDCQGLWVEVEVEKELGLRSKKDIENLVPGDPKASVAKFVQLCKNRVYKYSAIQTDQSKRLGYFMDWQNSYFTMDPDNNYMIWLFLKKCFENGWIYKGKDSVPWCPRCETAISQHEMLTEDYKEITHETVFFKLPIITPGWEKMYLLVWTTTPWTIPANVAVAVNINYTYAEWYNNQTGEKIIILHTDENQQFPVRIVREKGQTVAEFAFGDKATQYILLGTNRGGKFYKGKDLIKLRYSGPFDDLEIVKKARNENPKTFHTVIDGSEIVVSTEGTGLLHVAPGAGQEDFKIAKNENLPIIAPIKDNADYVDEMGEFSGKNAKKHPELIINYLKEKDGGKYLFKTMKYKHRYPACWRCKAELVWKVADEWYIAMDLEPNSKSKTSPQAPLLTKEGIKRGGLSNQDKRTLRERMIEVAKKIKWMPDFGLARELDWLNNMHDWLISKKNRYWGLALPIYECGKCGTFTVIGSKEELKEKAVEGWDHFEGKTPHKPFIDEVQVTCPKCKEKVSRIPDVGNPWLDAGIVPYSTIKKDNQGEPLYLADKKEWLKWFPVDFITESFPGQFKNWFYAMIAMSTVLEDTNPFKQVLGFGTLLGEDGRPMHKSWGNSIAFHEGADQIGVDVMRWMYARQNPSDNLLFGHNKAKEVRRQFYLLYWNIFKFYLQNAEIDKFSPKSKKKEDIRLNILDDWIMSRFKNTADNVYKFLSEFDARQSASAIEEFVQDLSIWYIRRSRNRVGPVFYFTISTILENLSIILSPFLPFITEEIYTKLTNKESVHLEKWPDLDIVINNQLEWDMKTIRSIAEYGHRERKENQIKVRQPLANLFVKIPALMEFSVKENQSQYIELIKEELNVKNVVIEIHKGMEVKVKYDLDITPELKLEGELRDITRKIQAERKKMQISVGDKIKLGIPEKFRKFEEEIINAVQAESIEYKDGLTVEKALEI